MNEAEVEAAGLAEIWAEAVLRQAESYRQAWSRLRKAWEQFDRAAGDGDGLLDEDGRSGAFRQLWAEAHLLVWSARHLELWTARLAKERHEPVPAADPWLKTLRDALEHLDEAEFLNGSAVPGQPALDALKDGDKWKDPRWRALLALPGKFLETSIADDGRLFKLVDPERLEQTARNTLERIETERLDHASDIWVNSQT